jgi:hypothetical protein
MFFHSTTGAPNFSKAYSCAAILGHGKAASGSESATCSTEILKSLAHRNALGGQILFLFSLYAKLRKFQLVTLCAIQFELSQTLFHPLYTITYCDGCYAPLYPKNLVATLRPPNRPKTVRSGSFWLYAAVHSIANVSDHSCSCTSGMVEYPSLAL